jgi:hypothetical protein
LSLFKVFDKITNAKQAREFALGGAFAAVVVAVVTAGISAWSSKPSILLDAALFGVIAWRVNRMSRAWSVIGLVAFVLEKVNQFAFSHLVPTGPSGWIIAFLLTCGFIAGVRGTFAAHKFQEPNRFFDDRQIVRQYFQTELGLSGEALSTALEIVDFAAMSSAIRSKEVSRIQKELRKTSAIADGQLEVSVKRRTQILEQNSSKTISGMKTKLLGIWNDQIASAKTDEDKAAITKVRDDLLPGLSDEMTIADATRMMNLLRDQTARFPIGSLVQVRDATGIVTATVDGPDEVNPILYRVNDKWESESSLRSLKS